MKIRIVYIFIIAFNLVLSEERSWNTTPFDRIWNKTIHPMMYRDPIVITPFDIRIGQFYWGGEKTWMNEKVIFNKKSKIVEIDYLNFMDINYLEDFNLAMKLYKTVFSQNEK